VLAREVLDQLVLPIVPDWTELADVWLVIGVSSFMIFAVSNGCEPLGAEAALVRLLPSVSPHVNQQVALLREDFPAAGLQALEEVMTRMGRLNVEVEAGCPRERL